MFYNCRGLSGRINNPLNDNNPLINHEKCFTYCKNIKTYNNNSIP